MEAYNTLFAAPASWINTTPESHQSAAPDVSQPATVVQAANGGNSVPDDWSKQSAGIDLHDQTFGIADIQAAASSNPPAMAPLQHYLTHAFSQPMAPATGTVPYYGAYNVLGYGQSQWPQQSVPLSTYSTLNGATSSLGQNQTSHQQPQQTQQPQQQLPQQQTGQASPPHSVIDPSLTLSNGTSSSPPQTYSPPTHPSGQQAVQRSPTFINHFQPQHPQQSQQSPPPLAINPMLFSAQNLQQQQRTLSPQQLHTQQSFMSMLTPIFYSPQQHQQHQHQQHQQHFLQPQSPPLAHAPSAPMQTNLTASSSSSTSSTSTLISDALEPSPEERKRTFQDKLRTLLSSTALGSVSAVRGIVRAVEDYGVTEVEPHTRVEIMSKIRDNAGNQFFRAWSENVDAVDILREWLKAGATAREGGPVGETVMPLLHVIDRLPLTIEQLKQVKIGKIIVRLTKEPPNAAIKDMASNIERKWRQMMLTPDLKKSEIVIEDKSKKRKLLMDATAPSKTVPPTKKVALGGTSRVGVKKEAKVVVTAVKDAKADSSFFSAPKPKPKLPSFKKAPIPPPSAASNGDIGGTAGSTTNGIKEEILDPFQEALKAMAKNRTASPAVSTPEPVGLSTPAAPGTSSRTSKKRKTVTWAADDQLEKVRLIEKAIYDDDPADGVQHVHSVRELERGEGAALHAQNLFEELVDWYEPIPLEIPEDISVGLRPGAESEEKNTQEEREKGALASFYLTDAQIPDSPAEPSSQIVADQVDVNVKIMLAGVDIQPFFQQAMSVSDLVGQLRAPEAPGQMMGYGQADVAMSDAANGNINAALNNINLHTLGLDPSALSMLAQQLGQLGPTAAPDVYPGYGAGDANEYGPAAQAQQSWAGYADEHDGYGEYDERDRNRDRDGPRGRGWRGRGRGGMRGGRGGGDREYKSKRPCTFYAQGRCRYGDTCDFSHDQAPLQSTSVEAIKHSYI